MIKYIPSMTSVVMEEIPDMVTLAVDITNCQGNCIGCHSPFLKQDIGVELTPREVDHMISDNFGVNCFLFLGEGSDKDALLDIARYVKEKFALKIALYSGRESVENSIYSLFDYVKVGPYISEYGPLDSPTTNQRLYSVRHCSDGGFIKEDITSRFWHKGIDPLR